MYQLFKFGAYLAIKIYCKKTVANFDIDSSYDSPKIIASNHPNSFFDAILIAVHYPKPIYFLARGDAFNNPLIAKFLNALHLIPIYRLSEGKNNLSKNNDTFKKCVELLHSSQALLIFSEGVCVNEWQIRTLKKGTARLALMAIKDGVQNLSIQPTHINYSSFVENPKEVLLNFNKEFSIKTDSDLKEFDFYKNFNNALKEGILDKMVVQNSLNKIKIFEESNSKIKKVVLALPAFIGFILNYWIYYYFKMVARAKTKNTVFYDSVLFGLLFICYPILVIFIAVIVGVVFNFNIALLILFLFPISAYCYKEYKK